tara:strand:- start:179 stop:511 length:333 start_codon:yes stop_codon:yes gene_type:complete
MEILLVTASHMENYGPDLLYKSVSVNEGCLEKALGWVNKKYATSAFEDSGWNDFKFEKDSVYTEYQSTFYIDNQIVIEQLSANPSYSYKYINRMPETSYECWTKPEEDQE